MRKRLAELLDPQALFLETGLLVAYDRYDRQAPAAGVVTGVGRIEGRPAVVVAGNHHQDPARAGDRHAEPPAHHLPGGLGGRQPAAPGRPARQGTAPTKSPKGIHEILPSNHRLPYDVEEIGFRIFDAQDYLECQPEHAPEMLCATARLSGRTVSLRLDAQGKTLGAALLGMEIEVDEHELGD